MLQIHLFWIFITFFPSKFLTMLLFSNNAVTAIYHLEKQKENNTPEIHTENITKETCF